MHLMDFLFLSTVGRVRGEMVLTVAPRRLLRACPGRVAVCFSTAVIDGSGAGGHFVASGRPIDFDASANCLGFPILAGNGQWFYGAVASGEWYVHCTTNAIIGVAEFFLNGYEPQKAVEEERGGG